MNPQEDLEGLCVWKLMSEDANSTTFYDVHEGHDLFKCYSCAGVNDGSCYYYVEYKHKEARL